MDDPTPSWVAAGDQVTTVDELVDQPVGTVLITARGRAVEVRPSEWRNPPNPTTVYRYITGRLEYYATRVIVDDAPLTVVVRP